MDASNLSLISSQGTEYIEPCVVQVQNKITFTQYKSTTSLSKRYWLEDGEIQKQAAAQMYKGTAERVTMSFAEFPTALSKATEKQAFGYGVHSSKYPDKVNIVVAGKEQSDKNSISRTKKFYVYPDNPAMSMVDHDPSDYVKAVTPDELVTILAEIHPAIKQAARITRGSISAGVHIAGELPKKGKGFHLYLPIKNGSDIPRYGELIVEWLWLKGYGCIALAANGAMLERTLIDSAVFSPERLDFVGSPIISGIGLEYTPPEITHISGGLLDTATLPDLPDEQKAEVTRLKAEVKAAIKPAAATKQKQWAADKIETMQAAGVPVEKAREVVARILKGGSQDLYDDFLLEFAGELGTARVADVLKNPKKYHDKSLADPVEGKAYGATTAKCYADQSGKPVINSMAHGGCKYFLHLTPPAKPIDPIVQPKEKKEKADWQTELDAHVARFNRTHASVVIGGKHRVMRAINHDFKNGFDFYTRRDLELLHDRTIIKVGEKEDKRSGAITDVYANHVRAWAKNPNARTYEGGVIFLPGEKAHFDCFNTWDGFTVRPQRNDLLLEPIYYHLKEVLCNGKQELYDYLRKWTAYTLQNPGKQAGSTIVTRGAKGSGKGWYGQFLRVIWGRHGKQVINPAHLTGKFNGHLADVCFLFADEAFFSGDVKHEGILKGLITEPTFMVERKGIDSLEQKNYLKIYMATNNDFAVPATKDERRFCVLDVSSKHMGDRPYFNVLFKALDSQEVQAAFLYAMLDTDLTGFYMGDIPESEGLRTQRYHSMTSVQKWLVDSLKKGCFGEDKGFGSFPESVGATKLYETYINWCNDGQIRSFDRSTQTAFGKYLKAIYRKKERNGSGQNEYWFESLDDTISKFEVFERVILDELG
jgi:hypothetical protein